LCASGNTHVVDIYDENYDIEEDYAANAAVDSNGRCELYRGLHCSEFVGGQFVFVASDLTQSDMEVQISGELDWQGLIVIYRVA